MAEPCVRARGSARLSVRFRMEFVAPGERERERERDGMEGEMDATAKRV